MMPNTYSGWMGCQVTLQIEAGQSRIPFRGLIISESDDTLRIRVKECWDEECWFVDIFKDMITRVEADRHRIPNRPDWDRGMVF